MVFLATLAYPENWDRRDRAMLAMKALMYRAAQRFGKPIGADASAVFFKMPVQQQNGTIRRLSERLRKRQVAGETLSVLLMNTRRPGRIERISPQDQQRTTFRLVARGMSYERAHKSTMRRQIHPGKAYSLNDYAKRWPSGAGTFKSTVWRPEIAPLTMAFRATRMNWRDTHAFNVPRLLANPEWVIRALELAEFYASVLPRTTNLSASLARLRKTKFIRLVPFEKGTIEK